MARDLIHAPNRDTVVFHLRYPSASFVSMLAHPANFIYAKKYLDQDVHSYKQHAMGTGPFKLKRYMRGSSLEIERNPDYFRQGLPYLEGAKYFIIQDTSARATSLRSQRTDVEFRSLPPTEVEAIKAQLGDEVVVGHPFPVVHWGVAINVDKKPFDDERVRKALSLAIDRYEMAKTIGPLSGLDIVGGLEPPGTPPKPGALGWDGRVRPGPVLSDHLWGAHGPVHPGGRPRSRRGNTRKSQQVSKGRLQLRALRLLGAPRVAGALPWVAVHLRPATALPTTWKAVARATGRSL